MEKDKIIMVILAILVIISVVQAFQLNSINDKLLDSGINIAVEDKQLKTDLDGVSPKNIRDLPPQVGTC